MLVVCPLADRSQELDGIADQLKQKNSWAFNTSECPKHTSVKNQFSHQVIFDFLAGGNQKVPDRSDKTWQIRLEFFIVLLRVQSSVVTYLRLEQL